MSDRHFVDTNILVYAHDASAGVKHERARDLVAELWRSGSGVVSTQVLQELCVNLRKRAENPADPETMRAIIADYLAWEVVANTGASVLEALRIELRYRISFWDALIVHAAAAAGATILYSEDLSHRQSYLGVTVVNPLRDPSPART